MALGLVSGMLVGCPAPTSAQETATQATGTHETGTHETGTHETGTDATGTHATGTHETGSPNASTPQSGAPEAGQQQAGKQQAGKKEAAGTQETGTQETGTQEAAKQQAGVPPADKQEVGTPVAGTQEAGAPEICTPGPNALGVSRTIEIDTSSGPRFGAPYKEREDILADGEVVLTFDDGPLRAYSRPVLEALQAHCTKATFFLVGRMAVTDPEMVREYARLGHTVGIHTWSHQNLHRLTPLRARTEIELGFSAVQQALGKPVAPFFRFPYLADTQSMTLHLQERHVAIFSIDVDSKDYRTRNPETVHRKVMADLARAKKGIILFHDIQPSTARALPGLLADLKAKGYRIVHLQPKTDATTMAEFDVKAQQELERRHATVTSQPLTRRAFTWPVSGVHAEPALAKERVRPTRRHGQRQSQPDWFSNAVRW
jgi:peptidoglycan-N-acetylglucosamine deacetylase